MLLDNNTWHGNTTCGNGEACNNPCYKSDVSNISYSTTRSENKAPACISIFVGDEDKEIEKAYVKAFFDKISGEYKLKPDYCQSSAFYPRVKYFNYPGESYSNFL